LDPAPFLRLFNIPLFNGPEAINRQRSGWSIGIIRAGISNSPTIFEYQTFLIVTDSNLRFNRKVTMRNIAEQQQICDLLPVAAQKCVRFVLRRQDFLGISQTSSVGSLRTLALNLQRIEIHRSRS